jgi:hypothetical protein
VRLLNLKLNFRLGLSTSSRPSVGWSQISLADLDIEMVCYAVHHYDHIVRW